MSQISHETLLEWVRKFVQSILIISGSSLIAYNITAFKSERSGMYYHDDNQLWFAVGVTTIGISWLIKHWKEL